MSGLDAITLSVIQAGLQQVCDEMDLTFSRAAFSPVIAEANDRSDGIYAARDGALIAQIWHFFEHVLLQAQWLAGVYLFGAAQQISIGQLWFPRPELHFVYNLIVFVPLVIAMIHHFNPPVDEPPHRHERSERQEQSASTELAATGA